MRPLLFLLFLFASYSSVYSQQVTVTATTNKKAIDAILKNEQAKTGANKAYFDEDRKCRGLIRSGEWAKAEVSCQSAILLAEKLPSEHILERSSARESLGVVYLWQRRPVEAISLFNKSLEISKPILDDSDAEKGDLYFLMGHAYRLLNDIHSASSYYEKAESTYRAAFVKIGDDEIRFPYGRTIKNIVEAHYDLMKSAGLIEDAERLRVRLEQVEKDFAKYLTNQ
jgi:tetratricopeptide (TPR) repeat protein